LIDIGFYAVHRLIFYLNNTLNICLYCFTMLNSQQVSPEARIEALFNVAGPIDFQLLLLAHVVEVQPQRSHVEDSLFIDSPVD